MKKEEIEEWIKKNEKAIKINTLLIEQAQKEIEFGKKIIEEIKKITPQ